MVHIAGCEQEQAFHSWDTRMHAGVRLVNACCVTRACGCSLRERVDKGSHSDTISTLSTVCLLYFILDTAMSYICPDALEGPRSVSERP